MVFQELLLKKMDMTNGCWFLASRCLAVATEFWPFAKMINTPPMSCLGPRRSLFYSILINQKRLSYISRLDKIFQENRRRSRVRALVPGWRCKMRWGRQTNKCLRLIFTIALKLQTLLLSHTPWCRKVAYAEVIPWGLVYFNPIS